MSKRSERSSGVAAFCAGFNVRNCAAFRDTGTEIGRGLEPRPIPGDQIKDLDGALNPWTIHAERRECPASRQVSLLNHALILSVSPCLCVFFGKPRTPGGCDGFGQVISI
jgi:hypothetical protein